MTKLILITTFQHGQRLGQSVQAGRRPVARGRRDRRADKGRQADNADARTERACIAGQQDERTGSARLELVAAPRRDEQPAQHELGLATAQPGQRQRPQHADQALQQSAAR